MDFVLVSVPFFLAFVILFRLERRRLINGVPLVLGLLLLGMGVTSMLQDIPGMHEVINGTTAGIAVLLVVFLVLPLFLVCNGFLMLRREGRRLGNLLSLLAGLALFAFAPLLISVGKGANPVWLETTITAVGVPIGYLSGLFTVYVLYSLVYGLVPHRTGVDFIVVHGSRLIRAKVPPLLASRLDRARRVYDSENARGGRPILITSGGQGPDEELAEARAMADYLLEAGVPQDRVLLEDRSTTTEQNLRYSKEIMAGLKPDYRSVLVTNNFHAFRTALISRRARVNGQVLGSHTAWYYLPSATIREFVGILRDYAILNGVIIVALVATYLIWLR
ncbi:YdcF family protein [Amycolatopsis panacis]|uniref:YdcF family protein n=1 Tax=Amycolatopsis panacis TaxID=2340917 RepID=A0A419HMZ4_9PSEU|nr:YdcF family protein [Amycolatopsis panacis]RJQ77453.1 YdcF family protein [Amycolatopsis panacis]